MTGKAAGNGPAAVPAGGRPLSDARRRVLSVVAQAREAGTTVTAVTRRLGGHPNGSRAHLEALVDEGLVSSAPSEPSGRGRPALRYRVTTAGRHALDGRAGTDYRALTSAFASHLASTGDTWSAREVGRLWASTLTADEQTLAQPDPAGRLAALLAALDFTPEVEQDGDVILLHTCPFVEEARANPTVICGVHQGLIDGALESWGLPGRARLEPFSGTGACGLRLMRGGQPADGASTPTATHRRPN